MSNFNFIENQYHIEETMNFLILIIFILSVRHVKNCSKEKEKEKEKKKENILHKNII